MVNIKDYKITVFGDSICKGVIIDNGHIVTLETNAIKEIEKFYGIKINNNSIFGQTIQRIYHKGLIDKYLETININDNNMVVISMGGNDCDYDWNSVALEPTTYHSPKTPLKDFIIYLRDITEKLQSKNVKVVYTNLFPVDSQRYFSNVIAKTNDSDKILVFLKNDISNISRHQECFNQAIIRHAQKYNCPVLDIRTCFLLDINFLNNLSLDGVHPNINGQKTIASNVIKQINN